MRVRAELCVAFLPLVRWVNECFPGIDTRKVVPWAGLRPMMPDMLPRVGAGQKANVFYNTGHGHLGWTLSAITAHQLAGQEAPELLVVEQGVPADVVGDQRPARHAPGAEEARLARVAGREIHEHVESDGTTASLDATILHESYADIHDQLQKL